MDNILEIKDLVVDYGIVRAIKGVSLNVTKGTIVAILGANGAGKSTTIRTISGIVEATQGTILFDSHDITNKDTHVIANHGIIQSPEGRLILRGLTVEENLLVGGYTIKRETIEEIDSSGKVTRKVKSAKEITNERLEQIYSYFPVLKERRKQQASTLSGGEQQMLAIGRALMPNPKVLLLDEPSLGLAPLIVQEIFGIIEKIKKNGTTILIVEQNAYQTLKIADYVYVFELGKIKTQGKSEDLIKDEELVKAYLGGQN